MTMSSEAMDLLAQTISEADNHYGASVGRLVTIDIDGDSEGDEGFDGDETIEITYPAGYFEN